MSTRERSHDKMQGHWLLAEMGKKVLRPGGRRLSAWMIGNARVRDARVVELAPGLGVTARVILDEHPAGYVGVDEDADAVTSASDAVGASGRVIRAQANDTGLPDASADVVVGEAMLTMQGERGKAAIIDEAHRLLVPGGRYAIHELCLRPDDLADDIKDSLRKDLARTIRVNARPLTVPEWSELLESHGFRVEAVRTAEMGLLSPKQMLDDEGPGGVARIVGNLLRKPEARRRVLGMRKVFTDNAERLGAVSIIAVREPDDDGVKGTAGATGAGTASGDGAGTGKASGSPTEGIEFLGAGAAGDGDPGRLRGFDVVADAPEAIDGDRPAVARLATADGVNLIAMRFRAGQVMDDHRAAHPITVQCLSGHIEFTVGDHVEKLVPGRIAHLPAMVPHRVEAVEDSVFLLSMLT